MKTIRRPLTELIPDPNNARVHGKKNLAAIRASLETYGQVEPLVVQKSTGVVIGGNGRFEAMIELGWSEADIVEVDVDDTRAKALGLALNRTGDLAGWDQQTLDRVLADIAESAPTEDIDSLIAACGFTTRELEKILVSEHEREVPSPEVTPPPEVHSLAVDFDSAEERDDLMAELSERGLRVRFA